MIASIRKLLLAPSIGLIIVLSKPLCDRGGGEVSAPGIPHWPVDLLGRKRQVVTKDYLIYALKPKEADRLREWIDAELKEFRSRYSHARIPQGVVFAIESGEEPNAEIQEWCSRNVARPSIILWAGPYIERGRHKNAGRPYCLSDHAYFRESFRIPFKKARTLGELGEGTAQPGWVCFLTTDDHLDSACANEIRKRRQKQEEELKKVPMAVRLLSAAGSIVMRLGEGLLAKEYLSIDTELMHLQRREVLWWAWIGGSFPDEAKSTEQITSLQNEIDVLWRNLWEGRPIE